MLGKKIDLFNPPMAPNGGIPGKSLLWNLEVRVQPTPQELSQVGESKAKFKNMDGHVFSGQRLACPPPPRWDTLRILLAKKIHTENTP